VNASLQILQMQIEIASAADEASKATAVAQLDSYQFVSGYGT
jgi:hypothetical protein